MTPSYCKTLPPVYKTTSTHIPEISNLQLLKILMNRTLINYLCVGLKLDDFFVVKPNVIQHSCQKVIITKLVNITK